MPLQRIGVLGGTFDPVHFGHLRFAVEFRDRLFADGGDSCIHLIPCHIPPHRDQPIATAQQRLEMLRQAIGGRPGFRVDSRELDSQRPSFSIDTLLSLRNEFPAAQLILAIGMDAFAGFRRWHRWQDILQVACLLVSTRPGVHGTLENSVIRENEWARQRLVAPEQLHKAGQIAVLEMTPLAISSSAIRSVIAANGSVDFLLPACVAAYITAHNLYRC